MLSDRDIEFVTRKWIGVNGGYLGDFSYRTHYEFYYDFCDLEHIDPYKIEGTTRTRFEQILSSSDAKTKVAILKGVLKKFPMGSTEFRTEDRYEKLQEFIRRCDTSEPNKIIHPVTLVDSIKSIELALVEAEKLIEINSPLGAVDRIHTAFHGYLLTLCQKKSLDVSAETKITALFNLIRENYSEQLKIAHLQEETIKILRSMSGIVDAMSGIRNRGSLAHPNEKLLDACEASLYINIVKSMLHYLKNKLSD